MSECCHCGKAKPPACEVCQETWFYQVVAGWTKSKNKAGPTKWACRECSYKYRYHKRIAPSDAQWHICGLHESFLEMGEARPDYQREPMRFARPDPMPQPIARASVPQWGSASSTDTPQPVTAAHDQPQPMMPGLRGPTPPPPYPASSIAMQQPMVLTTPAAELATPGPYGPTDKQSATAWLRWALDPAPDPMRQDQLPPLAEAVVDLQRLFQARADDRDDSWSRRTRQPLHKDKIQTDKATDAQGASLDGNQANSKTTMDTIQEDKAIDAQGASLDGNQTNSNVTQEDSCSDASFSVCGGDADPAF